MAMHGVRDIGCLLESANEGLGMEMKSREIGWTCGGREGGEKLLG